MSLVTNQLCINNISIEQEFKSTIDTVKSFAQKHCRLKMFPD